jgi:hypothetical protein
MCPQTSGYVGPVGSKSQRRVLRGGWWSTRSRRAWACELFARISERPTRTSFAHSVPTAMFGRSVSIQESGVRGDRATKETTPLIGVTEEVAPLVGTNEDKFQVGPRRLHVATRAVLATLVFTQELTPPRVPLVFPIVLNCEGCRVYLSCVSGRAHCNIHVRTCTNQPARSDHRTTTSRAPSLQGLRPLPGLCGAIIDDYKRRSHVFVSDFTDG